jgi:hypothetical protein
MIRGTLVRILPSSIAGKAGVFCDEAAFEKATGVRAALLERDVIDATAIPLAQILYGDNILTPELINNFVSARFVREYEVEGSDLIQITGAQALAADTPVDVELTTLAGKLALRGDVMDRTISGNTVAAATVVTTTEDHGLTSGQTIVISGSDSTPTLNGPRVVTVISARTFSVPVTVTVVGTTGSVQVPHPERFGWLRGHLAPVDEANFRLLVEVEAI